jgi:hypothetical protein
MGGFYRGAGGAGDAVNDAASESKLAVEAANSAEEAKAAAEAAEASSEAAQDAAEAAQASAEQAAQDADDAAAAAVLAQETAENAADLAQDWAVKMDGLVEGIDYSSKYYAEASSNFAASAESDAEAASDSADAADASAIAAAASASDADDSAIAAAASETAAASSASSASSSATAAANSAAAAASALDNFDDRYLGAFANDPSTDNDGDPLVTGALYFNSVSNVMRTYDGSEWIDAVSASQNSVKTYEYVATSGQTTFSGADANAETLAYVEGLIEVQINGLVLRPGDDYTATNGTSVVLSSAAATGDEIQIDVYDSFTMADSENPTFSGVATFPAIIENASIVASAATGTINFNAKTNSVLYYTSNASANFTLNIRGDASTTLNAVIPTGKVMTVVFLNTNGSTPYYASTIQIDGTAVTPKWQGAEAPAAGNTGIDIYTFAIIKTASNTYTVLASVTQFN